MSVPVIGYEDERTAQRTVGTIDFNGETYEIDWCLYEENGQVIAAEPAAYVFLDDEELASFINPNCAREGWDSIDELIQQAEIFICTGVMHQILAERAQREKKISLS